MEKKMFIAHRQEGNIMIMADNRDIAVLMLDEYLKDTKSTAKTSDYVFYEYEKFKEENMAKFPMMLEALIY